MKIEDVAKLVENIQNAHVIYVLEDGETYSLEPPTPIIVSSEQLRRIESGEKVYNVVALIGHPVPVSDNK